jgi:succinyl-diaminopimelate desuccinylase
MCDEESHDLTCTLDLYHVDPTGMEFTFDSRVPVMGTKENCQDVAEKNITAAGFDFTTPGMVPPHRVAGDSDFVQTLLGSYEKVTGLKGECLAIGGGTYVHELKNGVAFGAILPDIDTRMHGADEFMDIDNIMIATKVFADAIWELCGDK